MWEAIRDNKRRSRWLIILMGLLLISIGVLLGFYFHPDLLVGGGIGALAALVLWGGQLGLAFSAGNKVVLATAGARKISKVEAPQVWNTVEEMSIAAGLSRMPAVYVIDSDAPNAFATGLKPDNAAVAVTTGLVQRLNRDELQGVVAHEIGHIVNEDTRFMTIAMVMVGTIVVLSDIMLRVLIFGGGRRGGGRKGGGGGMLIVIGLLAAIAAPIFAQMLYFACSRKREYLADASAARFTRYPIGLASALKKISSGMNRGSEVSKATAPMYIVNPLQAGSAFSLFATHPPAMQRVAILMKMHGSGYGDYQRALDEVGKQKTSLLSGGLLNKYNHIETRPASDPKQDLQDKISRAREALDVVNRGAGFLMLACACGVRLKVPPGFKHEKMNCPRCGKQNEIPHAELLAASAVLDVAGGVDKDGSPKTNTPDSQKSTTQVYKRKMAGWESFQCAKCSGTVNLSPAFEGNRAVCGKCRSPIKIES